MFQKKNLYWLMALMAVMVLVVGCGSDDDDGNPTGSTGGVKKPALSSNINAPTANLTSSGNQYCGVAASMINMAQGFSNYFTPQAGASKESFPSLALADSTVYTWSEQGLTLIMVFKETATEYIWYTLLDGTDPDGGMVFDNFRVAEAREYKTGTSGSMSIWEPESGSLIFEWTWTYTADTFNMVMTGYDGQDSFSIEMTIYPDGSGLLTYTVGGVDVWWVTWNATGTAGEYYADGVTGTWTYTG